MAVAVANVLLKVNSAQAVKALNSANNSAKKLNDTFNRSQGAIKSTGSSLRGLGKAGFAAAGGSKAAVVGIRSVGVAIKTALGPVSAIIAGVASLGQVFSVLAQQDFAEAKVRSLGVNSDDLTKRLSGVSRELAGQASVLDLTKSAYDVASAGFTNAADAANILKAASLGATGGFSDINTVGDATTSVLNAYGLEASKAAKLVDGFIQTQNDGKIVIGEYAANIAKVAPVAAALGVPLEEVNAAVAQITAGGQGAEVTFTSLKTAFAQIAAGKVGKELEKFGITVNSSTLASDGLAGTLEKIKASGADAGSVIKAFGTEAGPSILALLNNTEKYNQLLENQKNSQGAAAKAAFEASDTINGALNRLQNAFTNIFADQSELGLLLKGTFQVAAVTVEVFGAALAAVMAPVRGLIAGVNQFFQELAPFGENVNLAFELEKSFQAVMNAASFATDVITGMFTVLGHGLATAVGKVMNLVLAIRQGTINAFKSIGQVITGILSNIFASLPRPLQILIELAGKGFSAVKNFVGGAASGIASQLSGGIQTLATIGGATAPPGAQPPVANVIQPTNGALPSGANAAAGAVSKPDMSQKLFDLNSRLLGQEGEITELEKLSLEFQIAKQKILEAGNGPRTEAIKLLKAEAGFEKQLLDFRQKGIDAEEKQRQKAEKERQKMEAAEKKRRESDPGFQMQKQLDELLKLENQVAAGATAIGNAFSNAFVSVVTGSKSAKEALADMMSAVAEHFMNMAAKIIAQQLAMILYGTIMKALGISGSSGGGFGVGVGDVGAINNNAFSTLGNTAFGGFAEGGYVSSPTNALIGEGGEPEYVIPESKMRTAMSRYSRGSRGGSVIPESGAAEGMEEGGGTAIAAAIDVRYTVERINSIDYVTADQFQTGMQQAAQQGAKQGEQQTLKRLQMSGSTRKRIGI